MSVLSFTLPNAAIHADCRLLRRLGHKATISLQLLYTGDFVRQKNEPAGLGGKAEQTGTLRRFYMAYLLHDRRWWNADVENMYCSTILLRRLTIKTIFHGKKSCRLRCMNGRLVRLTSIGIPAAWQVECHHSTF